MKDVKALVNRAVRECTILNVPVGAITEVRVSNRKSTWGRCIRRMDGTCTIEISEQLLDDNVSDLATMDTVVHEVLHTCPNCYGHDKQWKTYARKLNA